MRKGPVILGLNWLLLDNSGQKSKEASKRKKWAGKQDAGQDEKGGFVANSLHCHPNFAPVWALSSDLWGYQIACVEWLITDQGVH